MGSQSKWRWHDDELIALWDLLKVCPADNKQLAKMLHKKGKGEWPKRDSTSIGNKKLNSLGYKDGAFDPTKARVPLTHTHPLWKHMGVKPPKAKKGAAVPAYSDAFKRAAAKAYLAGVVTPGPHPDSVRLWSYNAKWNGMDEAQAAPEPLPEPRRLPPAKPVVMPTPAEPTTLITLDDGHGMITTTTIKEHYSTVLAKIGELSRQ